MSGDHNRYCSGNQPDSEMNPTPVAYIDSAHNLRMGQPRHEGPLFSEAQLNQAKADALWEAAESCLVYANTPGEKALCKMLAEMAAELEKS